MTFYNITVSEDNLKPFLRSITSHASRLLVKEWFTSAGLVWEKYWTLPLDARPWFIKALIYAEIFPSPKEVLEILKNEKRSAAKSALIKYGDVWWMASTSFDKVMEATYKKLDQGLFLKLVKVYPHQILNKCDRDYLPLAMAIPKIAANNYYMEIISKRLKEA